MTFNALLPSELKVMKNNYKEMCICELFRGFSMLRSALIRFEPNYLIFSWLRSWRTILTRLLSRGENEEWSQAFPIPTGSNLILECTTIARGDMILNVLHFNILKDTSDIIRFKRVDGIFVNVVLLFWDKLLQMLNHF